MENGRREEDEGNPVGKQKEQSPESNERVTNLRGVQRANGRLYLLGFGGSPTIAVSARLYLTPWQPITNISELCRRVPRSILYGSAVVKPD